MLGWGQTVSCSPSSHLGPREGQSGLHQARGLLPSEACEPGGRPAAMGSLQGHLAGPRLLYGCVCGAGDGMKAGRCVASGRVGPRGVGVCVHVCVLAHTRSHAHDGAEEQLRDGVSRDEQSHPRGNTTPWVMVGSSWAAGPGGVACSAQWLWPLPGPPSPPVDQARGSAVLASAGTPRRRPRPPRKGCPPRSSVSLWWGLTEPLWWRGDSGVSI